MGNICCKKEPEKTKSPPYFEKNEIVITKPKMGTRKSLRRITNEEYLRIVPRIAFYLKNKNISARFKCKCPIFAAGGEKGRIELFSNSLEHMGTFVGHKGGINSLCAISNKLLASGSNDNNIKIWDIEERIIIKTLSEDTRGVTALCHLGCGQLVSGSWNASLIIWSKLSGSSSTYSQSQVLTGHRSLITGIIRINKREIISGEWQGILRIWNIDEGVCTRHIPSHTGYGCLTQMKQHHEGEVALSYLDYGKVLVWGAVNNWEAPIKHFTVCGGYYSLEFFDRDLLLLGGFDAHLEFVDYVQTGCSLPPPIQGLHSHYIRAIQRIAKNILVTASRDELKVIDPISRKCYLQFIINAKWSTSAIAYFY